MTALEALLKRVEERSKKADRIVCDIAAGTHRWQMCVPPQPDDSDMVLIGSVREDIGLLAKLVKIQGEALEKVADPRKRDHLEPDDYTKLGCTMNIANEAIAECEKLAEPKN